MMRISHMRAPNARTRKIDHVLVVVTRLFKNSIPLPEHTRYERLDHLLVDGTSEKIPHKMAVALYRPPLRGSTCMIVYASCCVLLLCVHVPNVQPLRFKLTVAIVMWLLRPQIHVYQSTAYATP